LQFCRIEQISLTILTRDSERAIVPPKASIHRRIKVEDWRPQLYLQFEAERTRPASDLLSRTPNVAPKKVVDLGCGPGNSTELLAEKFPSADILGLDTSEAMLEQARARLPRAHFEKADIATWRNAEPLDLIFANAVLQWTPGHIGLMTRLVAQLAPHGCLAVQVPDNFDEPSHVLMREVAARAPFKAKLGAAAAAREKIGAFADYYVALAPHCAVIDIWRTTYVHALAGPNAIVSWVESTGLRPFLAPLDAEERKSFLAQYGAAIAAAYPPLPDGRVLLPFPRLFIVATRGPSAEAHG
jgi:trans-aconitate 2-methyltransferase